MANRIRTMAQKINSSASDSLLLSYTYFLNDAHTCKILISFDVNDFSAKIILQRNPHRGISISYNDWADFRSKQLKTNQENKTSQNQKLVFGSQGQEQTFLLKPNEASKFLALVEFLNNVIYYNFHAVESVQDYYNKYTQRCREKGVMKLQAEDFFIPIRSSYVHCNYSRLFYEIPIFCTFRIIEDLVLSSCTDVNFNGIIQK